MALKSALKRISALFMCAALCIAMTACGGKVQQETTTAPITEDTTVLTTESTTAETTETTTEPLPETEQVRFDPSWQYAENSAVHTDAATLYYSRADSRKNRVICVNAGHGCRGAQDKYTYCHPDKTPKVTGGSTAAGSIKAVCISSGTTFPDGTSEGDATLQLALILKQLLLDEGYDVLMVRTDEDAQLDNIARTVIANNNADCHIALHYDSTQNDKGLFCCTVPDIASYRAMEPVKSHFAEHLRLGDAIIEGERSAGVKIYGEGKTEIDLTQTSYSTVPSALVEVGDRASDHSAAHQTEIAQGIVNGINAFFA